MWINLRILVGVTTGLGTSFGIFGNRDHVAENEVRRFLMLPPLVPPPEELKRLHKCPYLSWDYNWDKRAAVKKDKAGMLTVTEDKSLLKIKKHLILIMDCHHVNDTGEGAPSLTAIGELQARDIASYLALWMSWEKWLQYATIVHSPLTRSKELAKIIQQKLVNTKISELDLLTEGIPATRSPRPMDLPASAATDVYEDQARLEAAFRALFYRPEPNQKKDSVQIVLAHPNVIRYFICRALQFPPEAYVRFSLNHGSITRMDITGDGRVQAVSIGDTGYLNPNKFSVGEIDAFPPIL